MKFIYKLNIPCYFEKNQHILKMKTSVLELLKFRYVRYLMYAISLVAITTLTLFLLPHTHETGEDWGAAFPTLLFWGGIATATYCVHWLFRRPWKDFLEFPLIATPLIISLWGFKALGMFVGNALRDGAWTPLGYFAGTTLLLVLLVEGINLLLTRYLTKKGYELKR